MKGIHRSGFIRSAATLTVFSFLLSACLMSEEEADSGAEVATDNEVSGSVGDGPIVGATMRILRNDGVELSQLESDANASYNITVRTKGKYYPLGVDARNGTDIVTNTAPDFDLLGAVLEPGKKSVANINPFSTFAVELARDLPGGIDKTNLLTAQSIVTSELNNGLSSLATTGAMATKIDGSNIAEIIRASEALGETVRRTRDALRASGFSTSGNNVVRAIASDLTDSAIDGRGGSRADARTAAVWNIVSAQVLLETMANELHVNGADATDLMTNAINQVSVGTANPTLANLTVTTQMITRARIGVVAAHAVTSDPNIADLLTDMSGIQSGSGSSTVRNFALPGDYRSRLDNAVVLAADGSTSVVATVNDISRDGTQTIDGAGGGNRAPSISGTPPSSVEIGATYSFTPIASDPDDDPISFTISGLPPWASFNNATGELSGAPGAAGVHSGIVISVTDGSLSTSLPAFSITVEDPIVILGSVTLSWIAPTQNEDGTALTDLAGYKIYWGTTSGSY
ncbi:MAG: putative Ig domain-containing protein, partial [Gammaproteobacteria bacterium]|nr:putative Ig domain-containing protein [Gammaproteobacteria bacterium]